MKRVIFIIVLACCYCSVFSNNSCHQVCFAEESICLFAIDQKIDIASVLDVESSNTEKTNFCTQVLKKAIEKVNVAVSRGANISSINMLMTVTIASDDFSSNNGSGGSGWIGNWLFSSTSVVSSSPGNSTTPPLMFMNGGSSARADRTVDLSGYSSATLTFDYECDDSSSGFENNDAINVLVSTDGGSTFTNTVYTRNGDQICPESNNNQSANITVNIPAGSANTVIRFESQLNSGSEDIYWDNILVEGTPNSGGSTSNLACSAGATEITGTVFEDYNYNGTYNSGEFLGVETITVTATDSLGNSFSDVTDANGDYAITGLTIGRTYRIEFTNIPSWASPTFYGGDNGTLVQFAEAGSCANLGLASPADYCETENPKLATPCYVEGDPLGGGLSGAMDWFVGFKYNYSGEKDAAGYDAPDYMIDGTTIGSTWGLAYQPQSQSIFVAANMKRLSGFGVDGTDAIYRIDVSGASPVVSSFLNLNTYPGVNTGSDTRDGSFNNSLDPDPTVDSKDINAFYQVGKIAFGDIDISDDGRTLYTINLNDRTLEEIYIGDTPTAPTSINSYNITTAMVSLFPGGCSSSNDYRPWAIKYYKEKVYVGVVCSAETSQNTSELHAYIISFDPANPSGGFSAVFDFDLNYSRAEILDYGGLIIDGEWRPWVNNWNQVTVVGGDNNAGAPQPILSDIEFDGDGSMILGFLDRFGHQSGFFSYGSNPSDNTLYIGISGGDLLRVCKSGNSYVLEGNAGCTYGARTEYYDEEIFYNPDVFGNPLTHSELSFGGIAQLAGAGEVALTMYDPYYIQSGGVIYFNNQNGNTSHKYELYNFNETSSGGPFGKANGLGDLEVMCDPAPIEIGNFVWEDTNANGVQDAGELGLENIEVELYNSAGVLLASQTTNNLGHYFFSGDGTDNATWQNANETLQPNTSYYIVAGGNGQFAAGEMILNGKTYLLTQSNVNVGANSDEIDSDGVIASGIDNDFNGEPYVQITTGGIGQVNHSFDFGFEPECNIDINTTLNICVDDGNGTFRAIYDATISWEGRPNTELIEVYLNGTLFKTIDPDASTSPHAFDFEVAADGTGQESLWAYFATTMTCGDTLSFKSPAPCPTNLGDDPGQVCVNAAGFISGTVWEDWDYNGVMDEVNIIGIQGIQVNLYDDCGNISQTTYTDSSGNYEFPGLNNSTTYRVEFALPETVSCWAKPTKAGADNGTTVQFLQPGNCASLGVASPTDYCDTDPYLATPCFVFGEQSDPGNPNSMDGVLVSFKSTWGEDNVAPIESSTDIADWQTGGTPQYIALANQIGTTYGMAYDNINHKLYAGAFLKNFAGFGSAGPGGIYEMQIDPKTGQVIPSTVQEFIQLNNLGVSVCSDPHGDDLTNVTVLDNLMNQVGKCGLGDVEISDDGQFLYTVNLSSKEVVAIRISDGSLYGKWKVPENQAETSDPSTDIRPFALAYKSGKIYVGIMATGESTQNQNDIWAYVYEMDPVSGSFTQILKGNYLADFPVHYGRPWQSSWANLRNDAFALPENNGDLLGHVSPILADIEFYGKDMTLSFRNRSSDQWGDDIPDPLHPTPNTLVSTIQVGKLVCAYWDGTQYQIEANGDCGASRSASQAGIVGYDGNTIQTEFYWGDGRNQFYGGSGAHPDGSYGGLATIGGDRLVWNSGSVLDAFGLAAYDYGAVGIISYDTGAPLNGYGIYQGRRGEGIFGKSSGLGDLEAICASPPIEIGNYVWEDTDKDGIQDACESGIDAVTIELLKGTTLIASTQTNNAGQYYFSDKNSTDPNLNWVGTDVDTALLANTTYILRISNAEGNSQQIALEGFELTETDVNSNESDQIDNDAALTGTSAEITTTTGEYGCADHSLDFGFIPCVADAGDLGTNPNITDFNVCEGADLVNGASTSVAFVANYSAADENEPNATYYNYQYLLANAAGTILQSGTSGDFDFSILSAGTYNIYGLSYSTNNSPNTVSSYLNGITGDGNADDISQINTDEAGEVYCLDLDGLNTAGSQVQVIVNPLPTLTVTNTQCAFNFQTYSIDVTSDADDLTSTAGTVTNNNNGTFEVSGIPAGTDITLTAVFNATACEVEQNVNAPSCTCPTVDPPSNPNNPEICDGAATPTLTVSVGAGETVDWYSTSSGGAALATSTTSYTPTGSFGVGTTTYYAETRNTISTCTSSTRTPVTLTVNANPTAAPSANEPCAGETLNILANAASGDGSYTYSWTGPNGFSSNQANPTINGATYIASGIYYLTATDGNLCEVQEQVNVLVRRDVCLPVKATIKRTNQN